MKNRIIAGAAAAALATVGLLAVAAPASATYGGEVCTPSAAWTEVVEIPAVGEPTLTVENPDYVPAVPGVPAQGEPTISVEVSNPDYRAPVPAVTKTEYLYKQLVTGKEKWLDSLTWNPGLGWYYAHQERVVEVTPAQPAVGTPTIWVNQPNPYYVPAVPEVPAVGEPTISTPNPDYVPASTENIEHPAVTCPTGPGHNANGEATCGAWSITLYNQQDEGYEARTASFVVYIDGEFDQAYAVAGGEQETISGTFPEDSGNHQVIVRTGAAQGDEFVFSLDVTSDCIVAQPEPEIVTEQATPEIPCDAEVGDEIATTTTVTTTPYVLSEGAWVPGEPVVTTEDSTYVVTEADVAALEECPVTPTEPTTPTTPVVTPTTPLTPAVATPAKAAAASDDALAQTGGTVDHGALGFASLLLIAGLGVLGFRRLARR